MEIEYRVYGQDRDVPQPKGPVRIDVPDGASYEQVGRILGGVVRDVVTIEGPRDPDSLIAADHGWRIVCR